MVALFYAQEVIDMDAAKEQSEAEAIATKTAPGPEEGKRERSTISFPYGDLDDGVAVAKALSTHGGMGAMDQLAAWTGHKTVDSGTFKIKVYTARTFGLIEMTGEKVSLTDLGNEITRPDSESAARARAFLHVPLYRTIYDKYRGRLLPGDAVLEADMVEAGVASKQKGRARQGFQRSAEQAKLGKDRLVLPGGVSLDSTTPKGEKGRKMEQQHQQFTPSGDASPVLAFLLKSLPPSGSRWSHDARQQWMRMLELALDEMYKPSDE
jgi:hypothetical protein